MRILLTPLAGDLPEMVDHLAGGTWRFQELFVCIGNIQWSGALRRILQPDTECMYTAISISMCVVDQLKTLQLDFSTQIGWRRYARTWLCSTGAITICMQQRPVEVAITHRIVQSGQAIINTIELMQQGPVEVPNQPPESELR